MLSGILDASVAIALLKGEPGLQNLSVDFLSNAAMSTVNLAEVQSYLVRSGMISKDAWEDASSVVLRVEPFTAEQSKLAGSLIAETKPYGLSLADRACLALAILLDAPAYTTDRAWKTLKVGCRIHVIR